MTTDRAVASGPSPGVATSREGARCAARSRRSRPAGVGPRPRPRGHQPSPPRPARMRQDHLPVSSSQHRDARRRHGRGRGVHPPLAAAWAAGAVPQRPRRRAFCADPSPSARSGQGAGPRTPTQLAPCRRSQHPSNCRAAPTVAAFCDGCRPSRPPPARRRTRLSPWAASSRHRERCAWQPPCQRHGACPPLRGATQRSWRAAAVPAAGSTSGDMATDPFPPRPLPRHRPQAPGSPGQHQSSSNIPAMPTP